MEANYQSNEKQRENEHINFGSSAVQLHRLSQHRLTLGRDCMHMQLDFLYDTYVAYTYEDARDIKIMYVSLINSKHAQIIQRAVAL